MAGSQKKEKKAKIKIWCIRIDETCVVQFNQLNQFSIGMYAEATIEAMTIAAIKKFPSLRDVDPDEIHILKLDPPVPYMRQSHQHGHNTRSATSSTIAESSQHDRNTRSTRSLVTIVKSLKVHGVDSPDVEHLLPHMLVGDEFKDDSKGMVQAIIFHPTVPSESCAAALLYYTEY